MDKTTYPYNILSDIYENTFELHATTAYIKGLEDEIRKMDRDTEKIVNLYYRDGLTVNEIVQKELVTKYFIRWTLNRFIRRMRVPYRLRNISAVSASEMKRTLDENDALKQEVLHLQHVLKQTLAGTLGQNDILYHAGGVTGTLVTTREDTVKRLRSAPIDTIGNFGSTNKTSRIYNAFMRHNILTIGDLLDMDVATLKTTNGIGAESLKVLLPKIDEIREQIEQAEVTP